MSNERVNHPTHYLAGGLEVIDIIEVFKLGFNLGNTVKYILRAGKKAESSDVDDLRKAQWYLRREIRNHTTAEPALIAKLRERLQMAKEGVSDEFGLVTKGELRELLKLLE